MQDEYQVTIRGCEQPSKAHEIAVEHCLGRYHAASGLWPNRHPRRAVCHAGRRGGAAGGRRAGWRGGAV